MRGAANFAYIFAAWLLGILHKRASLQGKQVMVNERVPLTQLVMVWMWMGRFCKPLCEKNRR